MLELALDLVRQRGDAEISLVDLAAAAGLSRQMLYVLFGSRVGFTRMARALRTAGALKVGWTPETAADWILALTHVDLWQHWVVEAGWKPSVHVDRIVATLHETLLDAPQR